MGNWKKPKPTTEHAYAVMRVGNQYGVGLYQPGKSPECVRSVGLRLRDDKLDLAVARLNSRSGLTQTQAAKIVQSCR